MQEFRADVKPDWERNATVCEGGRGQQAEWKGQKRYRRRKARYPGSSIVKTAVKQYSEKYEKERTAGVDQNGRKEILTVSIFVKI